MYSLIILVTIASCVAFPTEEKIENRVKDCAHGIFNPTCLKIGAINFIEKLNVKDEVSLLPGVSLVKEASDKAKYDTVAADVARSLTGKADEKLDKYLLYHIGNFLDTHSLKFKLLDNETVEDAKDAISEGRSKSSLGGKKGGMGGILAMGMMMKGTLVSMAFGALALLAGKALMTAMMSLLLSAIVGIKSLSGGQKSTTYEIVSKPIYTHSHSHSTAHEDVGGYSHGGYGRSLNARKRRSLKH